MKINYFLICIFLFLISFVGCENPSLKIVPLYSPELTTDERALAEKTFLVFSDACQPLMSKYTNDIQSINISSGFDRQPNAPGGGCLDYRCKEYGWDKQIYIQVTLKNKLNDIPGDIKAQGHVLHFYLGGPKNPGITIGKFPELCGAHKSRSGSYDIYISDPKLSFIK
jgi:hypothetical protein